MTEDDEAPARGHVAGTIATAKIAADSIRVARIATLDEWPLA